jgi:uncharacterized protein with GYD domain
LYASGHDFAKESFAKEKLMNHRHTAAFAGASLLFLGIALSTGGVVGQPVDQKMHRYLVRAVLTTEGLQNFSTQPPTALKAAIAKFLDSVGGSLESWYFDYSRSTAYSIVYYPTEMSAATAQLMTNSAGFAHVTLTPLLSAEEADKAMGMLSTIRAPQQQ